LMSAPILKEGARISASIATTAILNQTDFNVILDMR
jgi:hypothetical protein